MAFTRRQIATALSGLYLTFLTIIAAYALQQINHLSLPIPNLLSALAVALPPLAAISVSSIYALDEQLSNKTRLPSSQLRHLLILVFAIYETIVATLAGAHISPESRVTCGLREEWKHMFMVKDASTIKMIQDALKCCGFETMKDMAWPLPDKTHDAGACEMRYMDERDRSCREPWESKQKGLAGLLMVVAIGVFVWKILIFSIPSSFSHWFTQSSSSETRAPLAVGGDEEGGNQPRKRPSIGYLDNPESRDDDESLAGEVERLNSETSMSSRVEGSRIHPSHLWNQEQERV